MAALALASAVGMGIARHHGYLGGLKSAPAVVVSVPVRTVSDTLHARETVSQLFVRRGVNDVNWAALAQAVRSFDPQRVKAGLVFLFQQRHGETSPYAVNARVSRDERLWLRRVSTGWSASLERIAWRTEPLVIGGTIDGTLYDAMDQATVPGDLSASERSRLAGALADVYDWDIDFARDIRPGDRFRVYAERLVSAEGEVVFGRILAARIDVGGKRHYAFRDDDGDTPQFWDENGRSLRRDFLRAPLQYKYVSSRFSTSRWQPILHYYRAHQGTDFAAPYGTPVRSISDGTVSFAGREGDYGNMVEIRHANGVTTRYGHLSAFAPGIHAGVAVVQGQYVGNVGASGLATGPHLHFEVRIWGRAVNPRTKLGSGIGAPITAARRAEFERAKDMMLEVLEPKVGPAIARTD
ncbi:MAG TPA: peptidoglycan DD-metalloendopeptidase family protein [Gemmatimonadales bacterium]|nr:peptidoglycan DD-metalloendopeptidase family protein [Gemmatimonadales bacterium]